MASTVTRLDIRNGIRTMLQSWPSTSSLSTALTKTSNTVRFNEGDIGLDFAGPKTLLEIDSEIMRVIDSPEDTDSIRVLRGFQGTTKASHLTNASVKVYAPGTWTDSELNVHINRAISAMKPKAWTRAESADFTWSSGTHEATLPTASGISYPDGNYLIDLLHKDSAGLYYPFHGFSWNGNNLRFRKKSSAAITLKAVYAKLQGALSADTDTIDNDDWREYIESYATFLSLMSLGSNRVRFAEYAAALNDRTSTADELIRMSFHFRNNADRSLEQIGKPLPSGFASTYRDPI